LGATAASLVRDASTDRLPSKDLPDEDLPEALGSTWIHNGRRDEAAEWRLVSFQPLWCCSSDGVPHVPVSVETVDAGARVVIQRTFLTLELTAPCPPRRARSLDARLPATCSRRLEPLRPAGKK
jgi:hypothetical protein